MSDFSVRSDNVDVEQIMRQIRARIREKRGVDYTEEEIRELANVKLEKFIDPKGVRSGLLEEYRRVSTPGEAPPNFAFGEDTLFETHRGPIRWIRSLLRPLLKMLFNPNPLIQALHIQADLNQRNAERWARREQLDSLHYEVIHNLVVEVTRSTLEVKSLKMRLESIASRLDFDERRARALEGVVQYRPGSVPPLQPPTGQHDRGRSDQRNAQRRDQGPRDQGPRDQGNRDQRPQGPRPDQGRGHEQGRAPDQATAPGPMPPGGDPPANALDNDGNERRARRRRRRGRRRPDGRPMGDNRGPMSDARDPMADGSSAAGGDVSDSAVAAAAEPVTTATGMATDSADHRSTDGRDRTSAISDRTEPADRSQPQVPPPASGSEPSPEPAPPKPHSGEGG